jgi:hypothetical protein
MADTYRPPADVARNAQMALDVRESKPASARGMTLVGLARARQLANREPVSLETIQRMASYFARHAVDKQGSTWADQGRGWQAWHGWGGDAGMDWVQSILKESEQMEVKAGSRHSAADMKRIREARRMAEGIKAYMVELGDDMQDDDDDDSEMKSMHDMGDEFNTRQRMIVSALVEVTHEAGRFDTSAGANGAHYIPAEQNVFMAKGICCQHCYFYQPDYQCAIVDAIIDPMAVCKLWVIPQSEIMEDIPESVIAVVEVVEPMAVDASEYAEPMEGDMLAVRAAADRNTTPAQREDMPAGDFVLPDTQNFPIITPDDVPAAVSSWGRYEGESTFEEFKAKLIVLAKRKGPDFVAALPQAWRDEMAKSVRDFARQLIGMNQ